MEQPLVSVIAITRNHERFCVEALDSILNQTYKNLEWIILDAASTDQTPFVIDNWLHENNVKAIFIKEKKLESITVNLNRALTFIEGEYVQIISLDDVLIKEKIEKQVEIFQTDSSIGMVFSDAYVIDENSKLCNEIFGVNNSINETYNNIQWLDKISKGNYICGPTALIKSTVFSVIGKYDTKLAVEDWDFWLRIIKSDYSVRYKNHLLVKYRKVSNSLWHNKTSKVMLSMYDTIVKNDIDKKILINYITDFNKFITTEKIRFISGIIKRKEYVYLLLLGLLLFTENKDLLNNYYKKINKIISL
jgi:glycosyltransferase involved in cell wall biosynthesis